MTSQQPRVVEAAWLPEAGLAQCSWLTSLHSRGSAEGTPSPPPLAPRAQPWGPRSAARSFAAEGRA